MGRIFGLRPCIPERPRILVLGSMPSVASLAQGFYYGHPQNRFWKIIAALDGRPLGSVGEKRQALERLKIALFDVIASCERNNSEDSSIRNEEVNDLPALIREHPTIELVITNGAKSSRLYDRHFSQTIPVRHLSLPSTSPANAQYSLERLVKIYSDAIKSIDK